MKILVIDGMGGGIGKSIIEHIKAELPAAKITAAGTNSIAASAMIKAGADFGASGENAIVYNCQTADFIVGVLGIVCANSMHGEVSPKMAQAVSLSPARKILIPVDKCSITVLGVAEKPVQAYIGDIARQIQKECS